MSSLFIAIPAISVLAQDEAPANYGLYTLAPCRIADTRNATGPYGGPALPANSDRIFTVTGRCSVPAGADAIVLNVTVTQATAGGNLRIYPGGSSPASASAINYSGGKTRANNGTYALSATGGLVVHCDQAVGSVHVILDVSGYFETQAPTGGGTGTWSRRYGSTLDDRGEAVAVDGQGRVVVTGHFYGTTDFGGGSVSSYVHPSMGPTDDVFVAQYAASGAYLWARTIGSDGGEEGKGIATDVSGNVLVTGYQSSYSVDYGGGPQYNRGNYDIFVAKYSSAGSWVWSKTIGGTGFEQGNGIAADGAGNVFVTGYIDVSAMTGADFGGGPLVSAGGYDVFLVKYSPTGTHIWSKRFGGTSNDVGVTLDTDASGNVLVAGTFSGTANFGGGALTSAGLRDIFVAKYSATGTHLWSKRFGGSGDDAVTGLAVDSAGDVALSGKFQGSVNFGGSALTSAGSDDAFLAKLSGSAGALIWSKRMGSTSGDVAMGVAIDSGGNVAIAGYFAGAVDFGGGSLSSQGIDVFVAKYTSAGGHIWSRRFGGFDTQIGSSIGAATSGEIAVSGYFNGGIDFGSGALTNAGGYDGFIAKIGP